VEAREVPSGNKKELQSAEIEETKPMTFARPKYDRAELREEDPTPEEPPQMHPAIPRPEPTPMPVPGAVVPKSSKQEPRDPNRGEKPVPNRTGEGDMGTNWMNRRRPIEKAAEPRVIAAIEQANEEAEKSKWHARRAGRFRSERMRGGRHA
jgi:hypothetical protein